MDITTQIKTLKDQFILPSDLKVSAYITNILDILTELNNTIVANVNGLVDLDKRTMNTSKFHNQHVVDDDRHITTAKQPDEEERWKPCPFCGCDRIEWSTVNHWGVNGYSCSCCNATIEVTGSALAAKKAWNRRESKES